MNKTELRTAIQNVEIDIATMVASMGEEIRSGKVKSEDAKAKVEELRAKKADLEKQLAAMEAPQAPTVEEKRSLGEVVNGAIEKRTAITLNGTGNTVTLSEIFTPAESKASVASKVRYFYGPNADTKIPVMGGAPEFVEVDENGNFTDKSPAYGVKSVTPKGHGASIKVSDYAKKLSAGNLDSELRKSLGKSLTNLVHKKVIAKAKSDDITQSVAGGLTLTGLQNLALALRDKFDDGEIYMSSTVYTALLATAMTETEKILAQGLIRDKMIEEVKVNFSSQMPTATSAGSLLAVGGRWEDMAVGIADQLDITPKVTAGSSTHTIDTICYVDVECVVPANFWKLSVASE